MLGSNDCKVNAGYWNADFFYQDYLQLIDTFRALPSSPVVFVATSPSAYGALTSINSDYVNTVMVPLERKIARVVRFFVINNVKYSLF